MGMEVDEMEPSSDPVAGGPSQSKRKPEPKSDTKSKTKTDKEREKSKAGSEDLGVRSEPGRKRRQVKRSRVEVDAKGYTGKSYICRGFLTRG